MRTPTPVRRLVISALTCTVIAAGLNAPQTVQSPTLDLAASIGTVVKRHQTSQGGDRLTAKPDLTPAVPDQVR